VAPLRLAAGIKGDGTWKKATISSCESFRAPSSSATEPAIAGFLYFKTKVIYRGKLLILGQLNEASSGHVLPRRHRIDIPDARHRFFPFFIAEGLRYS
jgi:hypothetical protein